MGLRCFKAKDESPEELADAQVNKMQKRDIRIQNEIPKLLLLGAGDSGKTTIFKQMRILYGEGYSEDKRATLRVAIINNLILGAQSIIHASVSLIIVECFYKEKKRTHANLDA